MCGITGFIDFSNSSINNSIIRSMTNSLKHRGPDGSGFWSKEDFGIYFGHRRLSIIDLSLINLFLMPFFIKLYSPET